MQSQIGLRSQFPVVSSVTSLRHRLHANFIGPRTRATTCLSTLTIEEVTKDSNDLLRSCRVCKGTGRLSQAAGGYHKKNPVTSARIVGTKWTARDKVLGWRHFTVTEKRKTSTADYALLVATCDGSAVLWVNINNLKDRAYWACGWLQHVQLEALNNPTETICKACGGAGIAKGFVKL